MEKKHSSRRRGRGACLALLLPPCRCSGACDIGTLRVGESQGTGWTAYETAFALRRLLALGSTHRVLNFTRSNIHNQFGELVRIARAFRHDFIIVSPPTRRKGCGFQTETLPESLVPDLARSLLEGSTNEPRFSVLSIWEVAIKHALQRSDFTVDPQVLRVALENNGFRGLPVTIEHAVAIAGLPKIHNDPFDRMLVAQALVEGMTLLTVDAVLAKYPCQVRLV
jgi:PIN domain nuclease of toxin-antitoxin system